MVGLVILVVSWFRHVVKDYLDCHCALHAAGLTYFSMLAIIPVLCCVLVMAKAAHVDRFAKEQINAQIDLVLSNVEQGQKKISVEEVREDPAKKRELKKQLAAEEFAQRARQASDKLFARLDRFHVGRLGWIGFAMLLWTVISSLGHVEVSFNEIWGIGKPRPIWKKAYLYLFVAIVMPLMAALAMSVPLLNIVKNIIIATVGATWLTKWASDGIVWLLDSLAFRMSVSVAFTSLAFAYFQWVMPNCRVGLRPALGGGLLTGILFCVVLKLCAIAQVGIAKSSAIYGSFAFLPIVLAWFYISWQVVLLGACMTRAFVRSEEKTGA